MPRRLILIIAAAAVLVIGAVAIILLVNQSPALQNTVLSIGNISTNTTTENPTNTTPVNTNVAVDTEVAQREYAARNFSESFGSGSSQDNFANWEKAKPYVTAGFSAFLDRTLAQQRQANLSGAYHAYLTKVLVVTTTKATATVASMTIGTQRQETIENETTTYYQDLLLDLLKVDGEWKVNAAAWSPIQ